MPVIATLALAGCGALFDSPDGSGGADPGDGNPPVDSRPLACGAGCPDNLGRSFLDATPPIAWTRSENAVSPLNFDYTIEKPADAQGGLLRISGTTNGDDDVAQTESRFASIGYRYQVFDPAADYLAFGAWDSTDNTSPDRGGFALGSPLPADYRLPADGTATYAGFAHIAQNKGSAQYSGTVEFVANFNDGGATLSGDLSEQNNLFNLRFLSADYDDGRFLGDVRCGDPGCVDNGATVGQWQAAFFGESGANGAPAKLGGAFTAEIPRAQLVAPAPHNCCTDVNLSGGFGARLQ